MESSIRSYLDGLKPLYEDAYQRMAIKYEQYLTNHPLNLEVLTPRYFENDNMLVFYHSDCSFSNFSRHKVPITHLWPDVSQESNTSENIFQCGKFLLNNPEYAKQIALAASPFDATALGRDRTISGFDPNWNNWSHLFMCDILIRKANNNPDNMRDLLNSGNKILIENTARGKHIDNIWGAGKEGTGANKLGICLMVIREMLQK